MSETGEQKYKWTPESTTLLVSVWTDRQVQKQLEYAAKPQLIWESVAHYMNKKGYGVTGKQCRSRMKQVLVCYREAKRAGTRAAVEQYYDSIDRVLKLKRLEHGIGNPGVDTVDSTAQVKSPPKDVKTNKNLQMRYKCQQPPESLFRTEALSPVWSGGSENYPDSPESNETVLAQPFRVLSPVKDAATNTTQHQLGITNKKSMQQNGIIEEAPIKETYRQSTYSNNCFSEVPFQNTVQNVQNQIIQENMQQHQAILQQNLFQNQILEQNRLQRNANIMRQNSQNINQNLYVDQGVPYCQGQLAAGQQNVNSDIGILRMQNNYQMNSVDNRAMPQKPRKNTFKPQFVNFRQVQDTGMQNYNSNINQVGFLSPSISPDILPNLNEAFCRSKNDKGQGSNEIFTQTTSNQLNTTVGDVTGITNNATFNDDTISIEFLQDSSSPDEEPVKLKDFAANTDEVPDAPFRKKKAEKLERLMLNAINSQTEVVNKILAAQNDMVSRVLDLDRDRQNRLETRIDHLLDVVQSAVLNKSGSERGSDCAHPPEPLITNLLPPPKPGVVPPKLDLVPPKPCRVPCTASAGTGQPVNATSPPPTKPGVISPITSPSRRVGAIWQKLGPVSTSPFVRAQQQLGFKPVNPANNDLRTQSSAERRIAKDFRSIMDYKTLICETVKFLEEERQLQEKIENARIQTSMSQDLQARRRLFTQREPTAAMILTAAFLEKEIQSTENCENNWLNWLRQKQLSSEREARARLVERRDKDNNFNDYARRIDDDILLAGQGDSYERLRQLNGARDKLLSESRDSSTPAKPVSLQRREPNEDSAEPRPTIQQLAQMVLNSARWRDGANNNREVHRKDLNMRPSIGNVQNFARPSEDAVTLRNSEKVTVPDKHVQYGNRPTVDSNTKTLEWLQDRYSYDGQTTTGGCNAVAQEIGKRLSYNKPPKPPRYMPMGFTTEFSNAGEVNNNNNNKNNYKQPPGDPTRRVGFVIDSDGNGKEHFVKDDQDPFEKLYLQQLRLQHSQGLPFILQNGKVILQNDAIEHRYVQEAKAKHNKDTDSENDEEFLDTTASMPSTRKNSITSDGTKSGKSDTNCIIS